LFGPFCFFTISITEESVKNLRRVSRAKADPPLPFSASWFYKNHHLGNHPEIFVKIGGALFIDLDKFAELVESGRR
jgi:hypothetical protein